MGISSDRTVFLNGDYVLESRAHIHFRDRGFAYGDAAFDTSRTFNGRIYRLQDHVERLFRSLRYLEIDPGLTPGELVSITEEVVALNRPLLAPGEDYWVSQRISRGPRYLDAPGARPGPTVIVECVPLPFASRAAMYRDGAKVMIPSVRRTPPESLNPNAKTQNYLNLIVAGLEAEGAGPGAWTILLDTRGFLCEGSGSNVFVVRNGEVLTPRAEYVLAGVTRGVALDLCDRLGVPSREADIAPEDAAAADEAFITSTSLCICPVRSFNGQQTADERLPGPVTRQLMDAFAQEVGMDFAAQYLRHLPGSG